MVFLAGQRRFMLAINGPSGTGGRPGDPAGLTTMIRTTRASHTAVSVRPYAYNHHNKPNQPGAMSTKRL
jgi:hypothetical protein